MLLRAATSTIAGLVRNSLGQAPDVVREGGGEEQRLALAGEQAHDLADVRDEAHVEHPVGLVEDEDLDLAEVHRALADVVQQPARSGDEDLDAAPEQLDLRVDPGAAVDDRRAQGAGLCRTS